MERIRGRTRSRERGGSGRAGRVAGDSVLVLRLGPQPRPTASALHRLIPAQTHVNCRDRRGRRENYQRRTAISAFSVVNVAFYTPGYNMTEDTRAAATYDSYLKIDELLSLQQ